jgi:L-asparaginase II
MPAVLSGALDRFGIDQRQLAVLCSSHSGEPRHLEAVAAVLATIGVPEDALRCGAHPPLDQETAEARCRAGLEPSPVCNNCSGAHAGMLLACRSHGWPLDSYTDPDHPLQQMVRRTLAEFAGVSPAVVELAVDNCVVPTFRLPLHSAALAFARLATGRGLDPARAAAARRIREAMMAYPEMVGGRDRFDSDLMGEAGGAIVCKGGAEGFQGIGLTEQGAGVAIKITDGNSRALPPAAMRVLQQLEALSAAQWRGLEPYRRPVVRNLQGEEAGRLIPVFGFEA